MWSFASVCLGEHWSVAVPPSSLLIQVSYQGTDCRMSLEVTFLLYRILWRSVVVFYILVIQFNVMSRSLFHIFQFIKVLFFSNGLYNDSLYFSSILLVITLLIPNFINFEFSTLVTLFFHLVFSEKQLFLFYPISLISVWNLSIYFYWIYASLIIF